MGIVDKRLHVTRDGLLFVLGILGIAHETLVEQVERPTLLILFAGMVGLPAFLHKDEKAQQKMDGDEQHELQERF